MRDEYTEYVVYDITMKVYGEYEDIIVKQQEKEYKPYRERLHPYDKKRCFKPRNYWKRTRSNPR